jgi:hypothetical protein
MIRRVLVYGWALYFLGIAALLVFPGHLVRHWTLLPLLALSVALTAASVLYALLAAYRAVKRRRDELPLGTAKQGRPDWRWKRTIERSLAAGWVLFVTSALVALAFPQARWSPSPESLLALCAVVGLSSMVYAATLLLRQFTKRPPR